MKKRHSNAHLFIYGMGDVFAFVIKRRRTPSNTCIPLIA
jgi:hypothetical protein